MAKKLIAPKATPGISPQRKTPVGVGRTPLPKKSSPDLRKNPSAETINLGLSEQPAASGKGKYVVRGIVRGGNRLPYAGALVLAYDSNLLAEVLLGKDKTRSDGNYRITYSPKRFSVAGKHGASLRICVVDEDEREMVSSEVLVNASADTVIDLALPQKEQAPSEFELLVQAILPLLTGQGPNGGDLRIEALETRAIKLLAKGTGEPEERIEFLVAAAKLARDTGMGSEMETQTLSRDSGSPGIPAAAFYGWFRIGLTAVGLWERPVHSLIDALKTAIAQKIIPEDFGKTLEKIDAAVKAHQVDRQLKPADDTHTGSLGDLLGTMPRRLSPEKARMVAAAILDLPASGDEFVKRLREATLDKNEIADVQVTRALGDLTQNHTALIQDLQLLRTDSADASLRYLASRTPLQWQELVDRHGVPSSLPVSPYVYAEELERAVEVKHPTAVFAARVKDDVLQLKDSRFKTAADFLVSNPALELTRHNARAYVRNDAELNDVEDSEQLVNTLQQIQRVQKLSANWTEAGVLLNNNLHSALNIVQRGRDGFVKTVGEVIPLERAEGLFDAAQYVHDRTIALIGNVAISARNSTFEPFVHATDQTDHPALKDYPNLRKLFGNLDTCACTHCQSVLSPAAYFVDVLRFLEPDLEWGYRVPLFVLWSRRPDLVDLELTCANTNTEFPYIDLVLEILENVVALPMEFPAPYGFDPVVDLKKTPLEDRVVTALRSVLSRSAISVGEHLIVKEDSGASLYPPFSQPFAVTDGTRTWGLHLWLNPIFLGLPLTGRGTSFDVLDHGQAVVLLDQGKLPALEWLIPANASEEDRNLPIKEAPVITTIKAGRKWKVQYKRSVRIEIRMGYEPLKGTGHQKGWLVLKTAQGQELFQVQTEAVVLNALAIALSNGQLAEPLTGKLPQVPPLPYVIVRVGSEWEVEVTGFATLTYYPERLEVTSLTYQSSDSDDDLKASPENSNPEAYHILDTAPYPWTLPFNLWLEEVRAFLARRGTPRLQLMEQSHPASRLLDDAPADAVVREVLGLSKSEGDFITGTTSRQNWEFWGLEEEENTVTDLNDESTVSGSWIQVLERVSILLQRSGLSYRELLNVLQTRFVQKVTPTLTPRGQDCNTSKMHLVGLKADHLNRIHRFVRLWRKLGWSVFELDLAMSAVTNDGMELTAATLRGLSHLQRLHSLLGLSVAVMARWHGTLITATSTDHTSEKRPEIKSVYGQLFDNPAIQNPPDPDFALHQLATAAKTLIDKASAVAGILGIRVSDLTRLTEAVISGNPPALSLANLASLYRNVSLAKTLGLTMRDYLRALNLIDGDPFTSFKELIEFVEAVRYVRSNRWSFTFEEIDYLLRYTTDSEPTTLMTAAWSEQTLRGIRATLQAAQGEALSSAEPPAEHLRKTLTRLSWYAALIEEAADLFGASPQFDVVIPAHTAPKKISIPQSLKGWVSYLASEGKLSISGMLSKTEWAELSVANQGVAVVSNALDTLRTNVSTFTATLRRHQHHLQSLYLPTHRLTYEPPPDIPAGMRARCYYDLPAKEIVFVGWMTETDQQKLKDALSPSTLQQLQGLSDEYREPPGENSFLSAKDLDTLFTRGQTPESRIGFILEKLLPWFTREILVDRLSAALGLEQTLMRGLLSSHLDQARTLDALLAPAFVHSDARIAMTATSFPDQFHALGKLHKAALICGKLGLKTSELPWLPAAQSRVEPPRTFATLRLDNLPIRPTDKPRAYNDFQSLLHLFELRDSPQIGTALLVKMLERANKRKGSIPVEKNALHGDIAHALQISAQDVTSIASNQLPMEWPDDYLAPVKLSDLLGWLLTIQKLGGKADEVASLTKETLGIEEAALARHLLRALFDARSWPEQLKVIADGLRERQRGALVAYLIAHDHLRDANDLYDRYLIDVEMGPCKVSTRILHAISAAQLFVQRCLMNLEEDILPKVIDVKRWQWMKNYRVWEANRKVFLYPENWIEPELRGDKSELFKELEGQLLQNELDNDRAEEILKDYLKQLEDISRLAIVGMYVEKLTDSNNAPTGTTVHIVGRTHNRPSHFFYRRWVLSLTVNYWTAWERVPLDGVKTDHVIPFVLRGDAYIAWPEIYQVPPQNSGEGPPCPKWRLQMAWTRHTARGWSERYLSQDTIEQPWVYGTPENESFTYRVKNLNVDSVSIECYAAQREGDILYSAPTPAGATERDGRVIFINPEDLSEVQNILGSKMMTISFSGYLRAETSNAGNMVYTSIPGAKIKAELLLATGVEGLFNDRYYHYFNSPSVHFWYGEGSGDGLNHSAWRAPEIVEAVEFTSSIDGGFTVTLSILAQALLWHLIFNSSPTFSLEVILPAGSTYKGPLPETFPLHETNDTRRYTDLKFHKNFTLNGGQAPPAPVIKMGLISRFTVLSSEDAEIVPAQGNALSLPEGTIAYASGYLTRAANQTAPLMLQTIAV